MLPKPPVRFDQKVEAGECRTPTPMQAARYLVTKIKAKSFAAMLLQCSSGWHISACVCVGRYVSGGGGGMSVGDPCTSQGRFDFGPHLVDGQQRVASVGMG